MNTSKWYSYKIAHKWKVIAHNSTQCSGFVFVYLFSTVRHTRFYTNIPALCTKLIGWQELLPNQNVTTPASSNFFAMLSSSFKDRSTNVVDNCNTSSFFRFNFFVEIVKEDDALLRMSFGYHTFQNIVLKLFQH